MKTLKHLILITLLTGAMGIALTSNADDAKTEKAKPYPLDTCLVCGMKLGSGDMGGMNMGTNSIAASFSFVYEGQEIKLCDQSEKAAFDKNPKKYMKKLAEAEAKLKK